MGAPSGKAKPATEQTYEAPAQEVSTENTWLDESEEKEHEA
jgi:hypothetical protein